MQKKYEFCSSCGMKFRKPENHALRDVYHEYCHGCTNPDGSLKSYAEVLALIADDLSHSQGIDRNAAKEMAGEIMAKLPAWSGRQSV
ncbi:MAG TPA: zinc ribbon domain-containing protein [archaeon]|nr:zinc ribbon domain-containing protein [archaeon]